MSNKFKKIAHCRSRFGLLGLWCCLLLWCSGVVNAGSQDALNAIQLEEKPILSFSGLAQYGVEIGAPMTLAQAKESIAWQPLSQHDLNLGFNQKPAWVRFRVLGGDASSSHWMLYLAYHALNRINYFVEANGQLIDAKEYGFDFPFFARDYQHRYYVYDLPRLKEFDVYLRVEASGVMYVPLRIYDEEGFASLRETDHYFQGLYIGVMVAMALYNLFLFFAIRERIYLVYIGYIVSYALLLQATEGFGFQYIWPNWPGFNVASAPILSCIAGVLALIFTVKFLDTESYVPKIHKMLQGAIAISFVFLGCIVVFDYDFNFVTNLLSIVFSFLVIYASTKSYQAGCQQAYFFIAAWLFLLAGVFVFAGAMNGLFPLNPITRHGMQIGSVAEVLMFSFALANRINVIKEEKRLVMKMQHQALQGLKQAELEIYEIAFKDRLTGLPNRELMTANFVKRLRGEDHFERLNFILIHLKELQDINKSLGYKVGDDLLVKVAEMLKMECERWLSNDSLDVNFDPEKDLGALEGANFVLVVKAIQDVQVEALCQKIMELFEQPIVYGELSIDVGVCIGYSPMTETDSDFDSLLKNSQVAVEAALESGVGFTCYAEGLDPYSEKRIALLADLRAALVSDGLSLHLQPKVNLSNGDIAGFEALIRWHHPKYGVVSPEEFIPLAEKSTLIKDVTEWVLLKAVGYIKYFNERHLFPHISINVSAKNLHQPFFAEHIVKALKRKSVDPGALVLEITETAMMDDPEKAMACLHLLRQHGVRLSLDDFGTGYSSLSYLSRLPISEIKIDRSFVKDIEYQQVPVIIETTLKMAKGLGLISVAEGIESQQALDQLKELGCDIAQGFYIARPMPFDDLIGWLADQKGYEPLRFEQGGRGAGKE